MNSLFRATKTTLLAALSLCAITSLHGYFSTSSAYVDPANNPGYSAQVSIWNWVNNYGYANGWTFARYSSTVGINYKTEWHATDLSNNPTTGSASNFGTYALSEHYWSGSTYKCVSDEVLNTDTSVFAYSHATN